MQKNRCFYLNNDFSEKELVDEINWRIIHDLNIPQPNIEGKLIVMFGKSNHYLEYKIKKDSIQPIENDRGMPSTRAEGLSVNENTTHAQLYKVITQKEEKSSTQNLINTDGLIYGFTYNNKIYLNPDIAKIEEITKINYHFFLQHIFYFI